MKAFRAVPAVRRQLSTSASVIGTEKWRAAAARDLKDSKGMKIEDLVWDSPEGIKVKPVYIPEDIKDLTLPPPPGLYPYTRGPRATMYTVKASRFLFLLHTRTLL